MNKSRFDIQSTPIAGLKIILRKPIEDSRGFLARFFCAEELKKAGWVKPIAQINHTLTRKKGAVRGMHFQQPPHTEAKIVSCIRGEIFDVALDIRKGSETFLGWHAEVLSSKNCRSLLVPEGFAHGFQALTDDCELIYLHSETFHPESEGALNVSDPRIAISWPLNITELSSRDKEHPFLKTDFQGMVI